MIRAADDDKQVYKLLILDSQKGPPYDDIRAAMLKSLEASGFVEGRNLKTAQLTSGNDVKEGERILKEEIKNNYDVIFVGGTAATTSAKNVLWDKSGQRVVFAAATDPVGIGVIKNFSSKPEGNFTGVCYPVPVKSRLRFVRQLMPKVKTLGLIHVDMPQSESYKRWVQDLLATDPEFSDLKVIFRSVPLVKGEDVDRQMADSTLKHIRELDSKVDAFIKPNDQMGTRKNFSQIVFANSKKPLIGLTRDDVMSDWGATAAVFPSHASIGEQAATMVKALLKGGKIADLTPEWPKKFGFAVDLPKAKQFGIKVPIDILQLAGENIVK
jgi:putative ABC transport system substrate-binding protein